MPTDDTRSNGRPVLTYYCLTGVVPVSASILNVSSSGNERVIWLLHHIFRKTNEENFPAGKYPFTEIDCFDIVYEMLLVRLRLSIAAQCASECQLQQA